MAQTLRALAFAGTLLTLGAAQAADFTLKSADAGADRTLAQPLYANAFGCSGGNVSPQISWENAPKGAKSFVVTMYDPDAPTGSGWWHWVAVNIPASVSGLPRGSGSESGKMPEGAMMTNNDAGQPAYLGACPPEGQTHRYVITVKALKVEKLDLPANATGAMVGLMSNMNSLGEATLTLKAGR